MFKKKIYVKMTALLAAAGIFISGMSGSVYAATETAAAGALSGDAEIARAEAENTDAVQKAYDAIQKAFQSRTAEDRAEAEKIIRSLSETNRVRLYVKLAKGWYEANYRDNSNKYFNAELYLSSNPDIRAAAAASGDPVRFALEHYLYTGIYEGRGSKTGFDPVIAILADPDCIQQACETGTLTPDQIFEHYAVKTGNKSTEGYSVIWFGIKDSSGVYSGEPLTYTLALRKAAENTEAQSDSSDRSDSDSSDTEKSAVIPASDSSEKESVDPSKDDPAPAADRAALVNKKTSVIEAYKLYFNPEEGAVKSGEIAGAGPDGSNASVTFYGDQYQIIKEEGQSSSGKNYTFMIYMCGSNQETNENYVRVTKQLLSMLKAGTLENINVLVCVGGSASYNNAYMANAESGIINDGVGIYYLDGSKVAESYNKLSDDAKALFDLSFAERNGNKADKLKEVSEIINADTFKKIAQISSIDMGDPGILSGFINLSTDLFPAENYGLSLSDHGDGWSYGVCFSADTSGIKGTGITTTELEAALNATEFGRGDRKLGLLYFDACMMGSAEEAYNLKAYYDYMLASEEVTNEGTDYEPILRAISNFSKEGTGGNLKIAEEMLKKYVEFDAHTSLYEDATGAMTLAVYSSEKITEALNRLNKASGLLSEAVKDENIKKYDISSQIFEAVRKSVISCYQYNAAMVYAKSKYSKMLEGRDTVDMGEFIGYLRKNLNAVTDSVEADTRLSDTEREAVKQKLSAVDEVLGSLTPESYILANLTYSLDGTLVASMKSDASGSSEMSISDDWKVLRGNDVGYSGVSLKLPIKGVMPDYAEYADGYGYDGSSLTSYIAFMDLYNAYMESSRRSDQISALRSEMKAVDYSKLIRPVTDSEGSTVKTLSDSSKKYVSFRVADTYESAGATAPADTLGSPMLDMLETAFTLNISVLHKEKYAVENDAGANTGTLAVDMICGEAVLNNNTVSLDNGTVSLCVDTLNDAVKGYILVGKASGTQNDDYSWQYVLKSGTGNDSGKVVEALSAVVSGLLDDGTDCIMITGDAQMTGTNDVNESVQHVFAKTSNESYYTYKGSVAVSDSQNYVGYSSDNVAGISAYHYVLAEESTAEGTKYVKQCLETEYKDEGIESGYFSVTDSELPCISESYIMQENEQGERTIENNGYAVSAKIEETDSTGSYSEILKLDSEKYDNAPNSGNGLLEVGEEIKEQDALTVTNDLTQINDPVFEIDEYQETPDESNLNSDEQSEAA